MGDERVNDWDHMRAALKAHDAPVELEIERSGKTVVLQVAPRAGRIGVAPRLETRRVGVLGAAAAAFSMPHKVVRAAVATALGVSGSTAEVGGPIRIVRGTLMARRPTSGTLEPSKQSTRRKEKPRKSRNLRG